MRGEERVMHAPDGLLFLLMFNLVGCLLGSIPFCFVMCCCMICVSMVWYGMVWYGCWGGKAEEQVMQRAIGVVVGEGQNTRGRRVGDILLYITCYEYHNLESSIPWQIASLKYSTLLHCLMGRTMVMECDVYAGLAHYW
jgi:hypothetical protein